MPLRLRLTSDADVALIQEILEDAPAYFRMSHGRADEAARLFTELPPGAAPEDKRVWLIEADEPVGVVELARNWPNPQTAIIGLLLLRERVHRRGFGRQALALVENEVRAMGHARLRIAVIEENTSALAFWRSCGFVENGERKPWMSTFVNVLEKSL